VSFATPFDLEARLRFRAPSVPPVMITALRDGGQGLPASWWLDCGCAVSSPSTLTLTLPRGWIAAAAGYNSAHFQTRLGVDYA